MTRAHALIALEAVGHEGNERVVAAVERSPMALDPGLAACIEELIASTHASASYFGAGGEARVNRTRGNRRMSKYPWES